MYHQSPPVLSLVDSSVWADRFPKPLVDRISLASQTQRMDLPKQLMIEGQE